MKRSDKEELVKEYNEILSNATIGILIDSKGVNVADSTEVRKKLTTSGSNLRVLKNRLAKIASKGTAFETLFQDLQEVKALIYSDSDPVQLAKDTVKFSKDIEMFNIHSALMKTGENVSQLSSQEVTELSNLPSKEELISKLLYILNAPVTNLARTLNEVPASFVRTLQAIADKKEQ